MNTQLRFKKIGLLIILTCMVTFFYFTSNPTTKHDLKAKKLDNLIYTIVIDAGSTGSRIHVFKLYHDKKSGLKKFDIQLINQELFIKVKPGLSSFSKNPELAIDSIRPLLNKALEVIPKEYQYMTRIVLKATAGLRLISEKAADSILDNIDKLFDSYPFKSNDGDVGILDGKYEGIYSWLTLNYALKSFDVSSEGDTCSLDLGGGSTQVTFIPSTRVGIRDSEYLVDFKVDESEYSIYAKSFLGFGLLSARMSMFQHDLHSSLNRTSSLSSVCLASGVSFKWQQQNTDFTVQGPRSSDLNNFENCYKIAVKSLGEKVKTPIEMRDKNIYAFSFYYDRLRSANMFGEDGAVLKLGEVLAKATEICNGVKKLDVGIDVTDRDYPFLCMDLTFIYAILSHGFGIPNSKDINVSNRVNKMEINWALGAAFHMLND